MSASAKGLIFALDEMAVHDGPGLRMTVYLKGCPLGCIWCHSPESVCPRPEVVWYQTRCAKCGKCIEICPLGLRSNDPNDPRDRSGCRLCEKCVRNCPKGALEVKGKVVSAGEMAEHAERLLPFFKRSGGGITLTGGEPMLQPSFSHAVMQLCRHKGIHTAMETCGYGPWKALQKLAPVTDLILFDLKHHDEKMHLRYTGVPSKPILANLARLLKSGSDVVVRVPLIPGCNDSASDVTSIGRRALELGATRISLLPFNPASAGKYSWLHRPYPLPGAKRQSDQRVHELEDVLRGQGLQVVEP